METQKEWIQFFFFNKTSRALKSYEIWMEYGLKAKEKREKRGIGPKVTHDLHKVWAVIHLCRNRGKSGSQPWEYPLSYSSSLQWLERKVMQHSFNGWHKHKFGLSSGIYI